MSVMPPAARMDAELVIDVPVSQLEFALRGRLVADGCAEPGEPLEFGLDEDWTVRFAASRHAFGWTWWSQVFRDSTDELPAFATPPRVFEHEVLSHAGAVTLSALSRPRIGHAADSDAAYRRLSVGHGTKGCLESRAAQVGPAQHRALRQLQRLRLAAMDDAERALEGIHARAGLLREIPATLHDCVLTALRCDVGDRLAELIEGRPHTVSALGIALGDRPEAWASEGRLAAPLQLAVAGARDRDVLAAAIEVGLGVVATDARVARLRLFGRRLGAHDVGSLAYLAYALDAACPTSWIPTDEAAIASWARAQCWADARCLPPDGRRYAARHGVDIEQQLGARVTSKHIEGWMTAALSREATSLLRQNITPRTIVERCIANPFPAVERLPESAERDGIELRRVSSGSDLRRVGTTYRNCLGERYSGWARECHEGNTAVYTATWADGGCVVAFVRSGPTWVVTDLRGPRNAPVPPRWRACVLDMILRTTGAIDGLAEE